MRFNPMTDNRKPLTKEEILDLVRRYIKYGPSVFHRYNKDGSVDLVPEGSQGADDFIPSELLMLLQELTGNDQLTPEEADAMREHKKNLDDALKALSPEQREQVESFMNKLRNSPTASQKKLEDELQNMPDGATRDAINRQRRLRQAQATRLLKRWLDKFDPAEDEGEGEPSDNPSDGKDGNQQSKADGDQDDKSGQQGQDGQNDRQSSDQNGDSQPGDNGENGDPQQGNQQNQGQQGQQNNQNQKGDSSSDQQPKPGDLDNNQSPEDTKKGHEDYLKELDKNQQQQGDGDGDDGDDGQDNDGNDADGKEGKNGKDTDDSQSKEDTKPGHKEFLDDIQKELDKAEKDAQEADKQAQQEAEAEKGDQQGKDGQKSKGDAKGSDPNRGKDVQGVFDLSTAKANPDQERRCKAALAKLIARGRDNPTDLPRWKLNQFVKRLTTKRNIKQARKPSLERKAIMFIIDNSPSMSQFRDDARTLGAALSRSGGPGGADVVVCLSFNGNYSDTNPRSQDGCWFLNGKLMGKMPTPSANSGVDERMHGQVWQWFIKHYLPRHRVNVHLIGVYGDYDGTKEWCYISHATKGIQNYWFNPEDAGRGAIEELRNPDLGSRGMLSYGVATDDKRYKTFRGRFFRRLKDLEDITRALRKLSGL